MFELPSDLVRDVEMYDGADSPRRVWMASLPEIVADLSRRWSLEVGRPYQPGGCASWVAPALDEAGAGCDLFRALRRTADRSVLLSTDLHPETVLAAQREPWLAIDPKPYVGDPTYDALQHMLNHPDRLATDPAGLVKRMADLLELDRSRLRDWLFARSVQESLDAPNLREVAVAVRP